MFTKARHVILILSMKPHFNSNVQCMQTDFYFEQEMEVQKRSQIFGLSKAQFKDELNNDVHITKK